MTLVYIGTWCREQSLFRLYCAASFFALIHLQIVTKLQFDYNKALHLRNHHSVFGQLHVIVTILDSVQYYQGAQRTQFQLASHY